MPSVLTDEDWNVILDRIDMEKCTPFLGAGASAKFLPLGTEIAEKWARKYKYHQKDCTDLIRVAQFMAVKYDPMYPKDKMVKEFENRKSPNFDDPNELHSILAELPLPVYMTTNYDDFMMEALKKKGKKPARELCRWNPEIKDTSKFDKKDSDYEFFEPKPNSPVVFHLHGIIENTTSLVLTEDDYLDFLVNISQDSDLLPPRIQESLSRASIILNFHKFLMHSIV